MKKIIFLDIDGTIRNFVGKIPPSAKDAIRQARKNGHIVCISTGRPRWNVSSEVEEIGFDGVIACSGGLVEYDGEVILRKYFSTLSSIALADYLVENGCSIEFHCDKNNYILEEQREAREADMKKMIEKYGEDIKKVITEPIAVGTVMDMPEIGKMLYFSPKLSNEEIQNKWGEKMKVVAMSMPSDKTAGGEISPGDVSKASGIAAILERAGFEQKDVIAMGDSQNDLDMIEFANVGIAMGNASQDVKDAADMITDDVDNDGLYNAFKKLKLI